MAINFEHERAQEEQAAPGEDRREARVRRLHDLETHRAGAVRLLAQARLFVVGEQRGVLRVIDVVVAVQRGEFGFDLGRRIQPLAQVRGLGAMLCERAAQRGDGRRVGPAQR